VHDVNEGIDYRASWTESCSTEIWRSNCWKSEQTRTVPIMFHVRSGMIEIYSHEYYVVSINYGIVIITLRIYVTCWNNNYSLHSSIRPRACVAEFSYFRVSRYFPQRSSARRNLSVFFLATLQACGCKSRADCVYSCRYSRKARR